MKHENGGSVALISNNSVYGVGVLTSENTINLSLCGGSTEFPSFVQILMGQCSRYSNVVFRIVRLAAQLYLDRGNSS